ncbi:MAG: hypothetical protein ACFFD2_06830 [Promethearchaeota archaeon]
MRIIKNKKEKIEKESKKRQTQINYFKRQITKLHIQFNFSLGALKALIDEVADYDIRLHQT